jgi:ubiquinol-cytochrome c reductase cytochrome b subunit
MLSNIKRWVSNRWPFEAFVQLILQEEMPGGTSFAYVFGSAVLLTFLLQIITGIWQLFYFVPTTDHAYDSLNFLRLQVPFGWLVHGLHRWGANAMIILVGLHMSRVFIWGAYKHPRQLTWLLGVGLLITTLALGFTGPVLPWHQQGYWEAEVGTSMAGTVPILGQFIARLLRGGAGLSELTLSRFFVLHVAILPAILLALIGLHIVAFRNFGISGPWVESKRSRIGQFWPDQILKDTLFFSFVVILLVGLSAYLRPSFPGPLDLSVASYTPKPEWYFLFLYQSLKVFHAKWEPIGTVGIPLFVTLLLILLPFMDRKPERNPVRRPVVMAGYIIFFLWVITLTVVGYYSKPGATTQERAQVASAPAVESTKLSPGAQRGAQLLYSLGCIGCHKVHGTGGSVGPDLSSGVLQGKSREWLATQIRDPKKHDPNTIMPAFSSATDQQVNDVVDFLLTLEPKMSPTPPSSPETGKTGQTKLSPSAQRGAQLFHSLGCIGCHKVHGTGGSVGPDLSSGVLQGKSREWLATQIRDPKKHDPNTIMPAFSSATDQQVNDVLNFLFTLEPGNKSQEALQRKTSVPMAPVVQDTLSSSQPKEQAGPHGLQGPAASIIGNADLGAETFKNICQACHGPRGTDKVPNPGSDDGTVPPLNPIDRQLFSKNAQTFADHIDRLIQHGSIPDGPNPRLHMLPFGDDHTLTQAQIANVEAYVMKLNEVERAQLVHPGIHPSLFFWLTFAAFVIVLGGFTIGLTKEGNEKWRIYDE